MSILEEQKRYDAARVRPLGFELDLATTANGHFLAGGGA